MAELFRLSTPNTYYIIGRTRGRTCDTRIINVFSFFSKQFVLYLTKLYYYSVVLRTYAAVLFLAYIASIGRFGKLVGGATVLTTFFVMYSSESCSETLRVQCGEDGVGRRKSGPIAYRATSGRLA